MNMYPILFQMYQNTMNNQNFNMNQFNNNNNDNSFNNKNISNMKQWPSVMIPVYLSFTDPWYFQ